MSVLRRSVRTGVGVGAVLAATLATGSAAAAPVTGPSQLPGVDLSTAVVVTDSPYVTVSVADHAAGEPVKVSVTNTYDHAFECYAPGVSTTAEPTRLPNVVTEASIVTAAVDYYRSTAVSPAGGTAVPLLGILPTGSLLGMLPTTNVGSLLGDATATKAELNRSWDRAQLAGHTAEIQPFSLPAFGTVTVSATPGPAASGPATDFAAGALVYCTDTQSATGQSYVFAGYEPGAAPAPAAPAAGSLGTSSLGTSSLGSK